MDWFNNKNLYINVGKTKDMVVDCRRKDHVFPPLFIKGEAVEVGGGTHKYMGLHISITSCGQQTQPALLRRLTKAFISWRSSRRLALV